MLTSGTVALATTPFVALLLYVLRRRHRRRKLLPPGPPGRLLIGNLLDMPKQRRCLTYANWGELYGPLTFVDIVGHPLLVINSYQVAVELLEKRGSIYSDRPRFHMGELVGVDGSSVLMGFGPTWAKHRKFLRHALNLRTVAQDYSALQERKTYLLLQSLLATPKDFMNHVRKTTSEVVTEIAYGAHRDDNYDFIDLNDQLQEIIHKVLQGYIVDLIPWLKRLPSWLPGVEFKRDASRWREQYMRTRQYLYDTVKTHKADEHCNPSYVLHMLREIENPSKTEEEIIAASAFTLYRAGNDTTQAAIKTFILAISLHPEVQDLIHAEIDDIIGDRLPTLDDMGILPHLTAAVLESLRWNSPVPMGVPHRLTEEDTYGGYVIPSNSTIAVNIWNISRDPATYENPAAFRPDRFRGSPAALDPRSYVFGFGRRLCPGNDLAFRSIWIAAASILWAFKLTREPVKSLNAEDHVDLDLVSNPLPFKCEFIPRFEQVEETIAQTLAGA